MTFAARMTRCPLPFDRDRGAGVASQFGDLAPELRALIAGAAGSSPYLAALAEREAEWLRHMPDMAPEQAMEAILAEAGAADPALPGPVLRRAKRRTALLVALADLGGVWSLEQVTGALTSLSDRAVGLALASALAEQDRRGRLPVTLPAQDRGAAGSAPVVALAMGKTGARELNYSSDIDLIFLFDDDAYAPDDLTDARAALIRVVRRVTAILSDITEDGYVFRTDLRLRPDASVTPVCLSMGAAEQYYEAEGRTWERAAYIKARACAGDIAAGARFLSRLTPFVWRRHLDFAAIRDAYDMRLRIRGHKGLIGHKLDGLDLKLGAGGIREIEFFTQTRQLIAGGRDPDLRDPATVPALAALAAKGWVPQGVADELSDAYRAHREVEHRLQMVNDAQTHDLPTGPEDWRRLACLMGRGDAEGLRDEIGTRIARVAGIAEDFFSPGRHAGRSARAVDSETRALTDRWRGYPALRSDRAAAIFARIEPALIDGFERAANPREALAQFDRFLAGLPAGVQIFSLFEANPPLVELIVDICSTSPALSEYLGRNSRVLDAVLGGAFFTAWPGRAALTAALSRRLAAAPDYEACLAAARGWLNEWHFRTGVHHLRGLTDAGAAGAEYSDLAEACLAAIWPVAVADFAAKYGPPPGRGAALLAMGSLGAGRLHARSDLDLIVLYDAAGEDVSQGPRPLPARTWYARMTQALVTALTAPMRDGRLYEVDMRLRPSGRQGPVATSLDSFRAYQLDEAWTWEHLALTRARPVAGDPALCDRIEAARRAILAAVHDRPAILSDTADMRRRLFAAKAADGEWDVKIGPGRLQDIELFAQSIALRAASPSRPVARQLAAGVRAGLIGRADADMLSSAQRFLWGVQAGARLLTAGALDMDAVGQGGRGFLLREAGVEDLGALAARLDEVTAGAETVIERYLPGRNQGLPVGNA
jgi:glutamate-ammonia-ligase adenylyltransferase